MSDLELHLAPGRRLNDCFDVPEDTSSWDAQPRYVDGFPNRAAALTLRQCLIQKPGLSLPVVGVYALGFENRGDPHFYIGKAKGDGLLSRLRKHRAKATGSNVGVGVKHTKGWRRFAPARYDRLDAPDTLRDCTFTTGIVRGSMDDDDLNNALHAYESFLVDYSQDAVQEVLFDTSQAATMLTTAVHRQRVLDYLVQRNATVHLPDGRILRVAETSMTSQARAEKSAATEMVDEDANRPHNRVFRERSALPPGDYRLTFRSGDVAGEGALWVPGPHFVYDPIRGWERKIKGGHFSDEFLLKSRGRPFGFGEHRVNCQLTAGTADCALQILLSDENGRVCKVSIAAVEPETDRDSVSVCFGTPGSYGEGTATLTEPEWIGDVASALLAITASSRKAYLTISPMLDGSGCHILIRAEGGQQIEISARSA